MRYLTRSGQESSGIILNIYRAVGDYIIQTSLLVLWIPGLLKSCSAAGPVSSMHF